MTKRSSSAKSDSSYLSRLYDFPYKLLHPLLPRHVTSRLVALHARRAVKLRLMFTVAKALLPQAEKSQSIRRRESSSLTMFCRERSFSAKFGEAFPCWPY